MNTEVTAALVVLEARRIHGDNGKVTMDELFEYIREALELNNMQEIPYGKTGRCDLRNSDSVPPTPLP